MTASNSSSESEQQSCCGKDKPMDSLPLYKYTSTPSVKSGTIKNGL